MRKQIKTATWMGRLAICPAMMMVSFAAVEADTSTADDRGKAFTVDVDKFGPIYRIDMAKVESAADLMAVPGVIDVRTSSERRATNGSPASRESAMDSSAHYFREHQ